MKAEPNQLLPRKLKQTYAWLLHYHQVLLFGISAWLFVGSCEFDDTTVIRYALDKILWEIFESRLNL